MRVINKELDKMEGAYIVALQEKIATFVA